MIIFIYKKNTYVTIQENKKKLLKKKIKQGLKPSRKRGEEKLRKN